MSEPTLSAAQAREVLRGLAAAGVRCWVMGGWGVDALLGEQTRAHHDLDLLVRVDDLPALHDWLRREGFARAYAWDENRPVTVDGQSWDLPPDVLDGHGRIGGDAVLCVSLDGQRAMHTGYDLPEKHRDDLRRLGLPTR